MQLKACTKQKTMGNLVNIPNFFKQPVDIILKQKMSYNVFFVSVLLVH